MEKDEAFWQELRIPCPKCVKNHNYVTERWIHGDSCKGVLMINCDGVVRCSKCGKSAHITKMRLCCDKCEHVIISPTKEEIAPMLAIGQGVANGSIAWFKKLLDNL